MTVMPVIPWVRELELVFGWHEVRDHERLSKWLKSDGATLGDPAKLPWCGDAMDTALELALPDEPRPGDLGKNPYWALNWSWLGVECGPVYGAIAAFKRPTGGHVGVLVGQSQEFYQVLGGNQGDSISRVMIAKDRCRAIRWPKTFTNPRVALPKVNAKGVPISVNEQ
jgi:uncharacterized protein (TIGR02594 family)